MSLGDAAPPECVSILLRLCYAREAAVMSVDLSRPSSSTIMQHYSADKEAMTSSFTSKNPGGIQLDKIIFYPGPTSEKRRESTTPTDSDAWPDIDKIFTQQEWDTGMEWDPILSFDATGDGEGHSCLGNASSSNALDCRCPNSCRDQR